MQRAFLLRPGTLLLSHFIVPQRQISRIPTVNAGTYFHSIEVAYPSLSSCSGFGRSERCVFAYIYLLLVWNILVASIHKLVFTSILCPKYLPKVIYGFVSSPLLARYSVILTIPRNDFSFSVPLNSNIYLPLAAHLLQLSTIIPTQQIAPAILLQHDSGIRHLKNSSLIENPTTP